MKKTLLPLCLLSILSVLAYADESLISKNKTQLELSQYLNMKTLEIRAKQGDLEAMIDLSNYYVSNLKTIKEAVYWSEEAANHGSTEAMERLGFLYREDPTIRDLNKSFFWFKQAGEHGKGIARIELAKMYANGITVQQDLKTAKYWLLRAKELSIETPNELRFLIE